MTPIFIEQLLGRSTLQLDPEKHLYLVTNQWRIWLSTALKSSSQFVSAEENITRPGDFNWFQQPVFIWLVVSTPLKNISQLGLLFPIYGEKTCSKPPTSHGDSLVESFRQVASNLSLVFFSVDTRWAWKCLRSKLELRHSAGHPWNPKQCQVKIHGYNGGFPRGTPKMDGLQWNTDSRFKWMIWGYPHLGNLHIKWYKPHSHPWLVVAY